MAVPPKGNCAGRRTSLRNTVAASATLRKLLGAASEAEALQHVYDDFAADEASAPPDTFPRVILLAEGRTRVDVTGGRSVRFSPQVFIQFEKFTDAALEEWYEADGITGPFDDHDHRQHLINIYGLIESEFLDLDRTAGCLEFQALMPIEASEVDAKSENGQQLFQIVFQFESEGSP
jgi:hypothetical protein